MLTVSIYFTFFELPNGIIHFSFLKKKEAKINITLDQFHTKNQINTQAQISIHSAFAKKTDTAKRL